MITKIHSYADSEGVPHASLEHAQKAEIRIAIKKSKHFDLNSTPEVDGVVNMIFEVKDTLVDILTTTSKSKPRARKFNGASRTRKPKRHEAEQFPLPMEDTTKPAA